jgi:hypothetical protein
VLPSDRQAHTDVSNTVDVTDPLAVLEALQGIFSNLYSDWNGALLAQLVDDFSRLYRGDYTGYLACDIGYHNAQHVLDVTLAMARLIDGHERSEAAERRLGPELAMAGMATALFHDSGYIRREGDTRHSNGAAYTRVHVRRSAQFMLEYLPSVGMQKAVALCRRLVFFTSYDVLPGAIRVRSEAERRLGNMLGSADMLAQIADVNYLAKCREHLYREFETGGYAGNSGHPSHTGIIYRSPDHLLASTPDFISKTLEVRLQEQFENAAAYAAVHFGGDNLYLEAIAENQRELERILAESTTSAVADLH